MKIDIVAEDALGREVLIALIQEAFLSDQEATSLLADLRLVHLPARYGLIGDLAKIRIADFEHPVDSVFTCELKAAEILRRYDNDFGSKIFSRRYLRVLVESWLRDIAFHWDSEKPPALDLLSEIGLAQALKGGDTRSEVVIETDSVR